MKKSHIAIFVAIIIAFLALTHYVFYKAFLSISGIEDNNTSLIIAGALAILVIGFVAAIFISGRYNNLPVRLWYKFTTAWLAFHFNFFLASVLYGIAVGIVSFVDPTINLSELGWALYVIAFIVTLYGFFNAHHIRVKKIEVKLPNISEEWKSRTAVFVSDIHLGQINAEGFLTKVVNKINEQNPDIVFIGGDLYDGVKVDPRAIIEPLTKIKSKLGTFFITGNHDGYTPDVTMKYIEAISSAGIKVLDDQMTVIDGLQLMGVGYKTTINRDNYRTILNDMRHDANKPSILLKHVPSELDIAEDAGISLQLCGHTHHSQVQPLSFISNMVYKGYDYGLKPKGKMIEYTSSGVGTWGPPIRIGTVSEIVNIRFS